MKRVTTKNFPTVKRVTKSKFAAFVTFAAYSLLIQACFGPKLYVYPEPILLDREPEVAVQFTASDLTIHVPVEVAGVETSAYRLTLLQRNRPAEPLMEKIFFPNEPIKVILPATIFSPEELGNIAILTPLGGDYESQNQFFTVPEGSELQLHPFLIKPAPDLLRITVVEKETGFPVKGAVVSVSDQFRPLAQATTDSLGYARIEIERGETPRQEYKVMVSTEGVFPPWSGIVTVGAEHRGSKTVQLRRLIQDSTGSHPYHVLENLVPFKSGPENGSPVLFFLSAGDHIQVSKVSGDRVFGSVAVQTSDDNRIRLFQGWVLKKYLELIP